MTQMCPNCSHDNADNLQKCTNCPSPLRGLLGYRTKLGGRYEVISVLGCGAMGAVYLAEDKRLVGRRCAVKENRLDPNAAVEVRAQSREQFLAETSVLARLDHPNLPKVSDYFIEEETGREYLVMDYVEGEDLQSALLRTKQPLAEESVLRWADQVLDALIYLHGQRPQPIIHRDIKPANIRVNLRNQAKLVDFGLVKLLDADNPETKVELRGLGTPAYAPLEQFASSSDHTDARSDIYALGATMYHLVTNVYPPDVHQRLLAPEVLRPPRQLNPYLSENMERVILRAVEIYPNQRYQTAEEMRQALREPIAAPVTAALPLVEPARSRRPARPISPWVFGLVGLLIVLLILAGVSWLLFGGGEGNEAIAQPPLTSIEEQPLPTPTELIVQTLGDAPTDTPTPTIEIIEETEEAEVLPTTTPIPTFEPTLPPTPLTEVVASSGIPASSLVGTIAYPVFNGVDYDLYFGQADGSGTRLFRRGASQPAFSPDGSRIAFRSWSSDSRSLVTMDLSGSNVIIVANFAEDQLPTWTIDGREIILLSRRAGDRKSRLIRVGSFQDKTDGMVIGEGEYPTIGQSGHLVFKGWGSTAPGLRLSSVGMNDIRAVTNSEADTAPALSPDGQQIAFMSRRDGNWEIYLVNADGSNLQRLTEEPGQDGLPTWSPDGEVLAFVSDRGGSWGVWVMTPNGSDQQQLFAMQGSPDGFVGVDSYASRGWAEERISWTR